MTPLFTTGRHPGWMRVIGYPAALLLTLGACSDGPLFIDDHYGPPSGYARVEGRVFDATGARVSAGIEVSLTRCGPPIGGFAGRDSTSASGWYAIRGELPPMGLSEGTDSLLVTCEVIAGQGYAESGPVEVSFYPPSTQPRIVWVDLHEGREP